MNCYSCGAKALEQTLEACSGVCMKCFKVQNFGFSPSDIADVEARELTSALELWFSLKRGGIPNLRNPNHRRLLSETAGMFLRAVEGYLKPSRVDLNVSELSNALECLNGIPDKDTQQLVVDAQELIEKLNAKAKP